MAKKTKNASKSGPVISRSNAIKKLQISLAAFRKLCILKGVYPVVPTNKKLSNTTTFYYRKDILYLMHDPILTVLRRQKAHVRKIKKALAKDLPEQAKRLDAEMPKYTLHHVIKDRYPTFADALRDLDDALSMVFLFATLPIDGRIKKEQVTEAQRLSAEFLAFVSRTRALRKVFLSVKGIYYQVHIHGQDITWIVPYKFSQAMPENVDYRVMGTFLELHLSLLGFVNYKLYSDEGLVYPPKRDEQREAQDAGLHSLILQSMSEDDLNLDEAMTTTVAKGKKKMVIEQLKSLDEKLAAMAEDFAEEDEEDEEMEELQEEEEEFEQEGEESKDHLVSLAELKSNSKSQDSFKSLFEGCYFWLSRETPRWSLEFVITSFGGKVGWDDESSAKIREGKKGDRIMGVSPFTMDDPRITHFVVDRPLPADGTKPSWMVSEKCEYLQPQWIYDCINAKKLLQTDGYRPGQTLKPHLSPFVKYQEGDYVPDQAVIFNERPTTAEVAVESDESEDEDAAYERELQEEVQGTSVTSSKPKTSKSSLEKQRKELAVSMMPKKDRKLYRKIEMGKKRREYKTKQMLQKKVNQ